MLFSYTIKRSYERILMRKIIVNKMSTMMGEAFLNATLKAGATESKNWIARRSALNLLHTSMGTKPVKPVSVHVSHKTRERIMREQNVDVYS